jgi:cell division protein FtsX
MARLILILAGVAALVLVAGIIARLLAPLEPAAPRPGSAGGGRRVPDNVKTMAYALLIVLMFGVVTGWLGGL